MTDYASANRALLQQYADGDPNAFEKLVEANKGLAAKRAHYFLKGANVDFDDLYQAGLIGLMEAIPRFELGRGFVFSTFAMQYIDKEMRLVRYGSDVLSANHSIRGSYYGARKRAGHHATPDEIFAHLKPRPDGSLPMTLEHVEQLHRGSGAALSLDRKIRGEDTELEFSDVVGNDDPAFDEYLERTANRAELASALAAITPTQKLVIELRNGIADYDHPRSWDDIAGILSITPTDVRRLERDAMRILHGPTPTGTIPPIDNHARAGASTPSIDHVLPIAASDDDGVNANLRTTHRGGEQNPKQAYVIAPGEFPAMLLGQLIERLLPTRHMTLNDLENASGVPNRHIYNYRRGAAWAVTIERADAILRALDAQSLWHEQPLASYLDASIDEPTTYKRKPKPAERDFLREYRAEHADA